MHVFQITLSRRMTAIHVIPQRVPQVKVTHIPMQQTWRQKSPGYYCQNSLHARPRTVFKNYVKMQQSGAYLWPQKNLKNNPSFTLTSVSEF